MKRLNMFKEDLIDLQNKKKLNYNKINFCPNNGIVVSDIRYANYCYILINNEIEFVEIINRKDFEGRILKLTNDDYDKYYETYVNQRVLIDYEYELRLNKKPLNFTDRAVSFMSNEELFHNVTLLHYIYYINEYYTDNIEDDDEAFEFFIDSMLVLNEVYENLFGIDNRDDEDLSKLVVSLFAIINETGVYQLRKMLNVEHEPYKAKSNSYKQVVLSNSNIELVLPYNEIEFLCFVWYNDELKQQYDELMNGVDKWFIIHESGVLCEYESKSIRFHEDRHKFTVGLNNDYQYFKENFIPYEKST